MTNYIKSQNQNNRVSYIDIAKGILIILLVFAHFWSAKMRLPYENKYFVFVYGWNDIFTCFYMPAFFLISGFCSNFYRTKASFFISLLKSLFIPLMSLSLIADILYANFVSDQDILSAVVSVLRNVGNLWFLQALILGKTICYFLLNNIKDNRVHGLIVSILLISGVLLYRNYASTNVFFYQHGFVATFFLYLGNYLRIHNNIYEKLLKLSVYIYPIVIILSLIKNVSLTASINVSLITIPLFLFYSVFGSIFLLEISKTINVNRYLEYWGKNSLVVYALHFVPLYLAFKYTYLWISPCNIVSFFVFIVVVFSLTYSICYLFMFIFRFRPFSWLIGKF